MRKTMRQELLAILVGPGAMCRMSYEDAEALLNELCDELAKMTPELRESAERAMDHILVTKQNIAEIYWPAAIAEIKK